MFRVLGPTPQQQLWRSCIFFQASPVGIAQDFVFAFSVQGVGF